MMILRTIGLALLVSSATAWATESGQQGRTPSQLVRVAAAADLKFALDEIVARLAKARPSVTVRPVYGSSGSMHAQLQQRAPFDVYLSADIEYPRSLVAKGVGSGADLFTYARGRIVAWVPAASTLAIERDGLRALEGATRIAIANPRHAPYGRAAEAALRRAGVYEHVRARIVLGENVAQAAQFVQSGAASAGIIAKSLAVAPSLRAAGRWWEVPEEMHDPLIQGGLILPWAASRAAAVQFRDFLLGAEGREILTAYGFGLPPG